VANAADQTFSDIIRGMQYAVNEAQKTLQNYQYELMEKYFDTTTGEPVMRQITLSNNRVVYIPLITLLPQSLLAISELEMSFAVQIAHTEVKGFVENVENNAAIAPPRSSFTVAFARRVSSALKGKGKDGKENDAPPDNLDTIEVKIKFHAIDLPEGASRVLDMLNLDIGEKK
jgi:hypothetical protein